MKYYKSKICYLDNYKNLPIGEWINEIDYVNSEIDFAYSRYSSYDPIYFKKNGDDLYVSRYKSCWYEEVLAGAYLVISKVYDELLKM